MTDDTAEALVYRGSEVPDIDLINFVPRCEVCTDTIPMRRLMGQDAIRTRHTCNAAHERILRNSIKALREARMCPNCKHPSTPEERKEFIQWRKKRGDLRQNPGNPWSKSVGVRLELAAGLRKAMELLKEEAAFKPEVRQFLDEMTNLIDGGAANKRTLRTGGETTEVSKGDDNGIER